MQVINVQTVKTKDELKAAIKVAKNYLLEELSAEMIEWLEESDFFFAPASAQYHSAHFGGLLLHSVNVGILAATTIKQYKLNGGESLIENMEKNALLAGFLHDVCKINSYKKDQRWRKVDGKWQSYNGYSFLEDDLPFGHGEKSVIMLQQHFTLPLDILLAIRWHMGLPTEYAEKLAFSTAMTRSPIIPAVHAADMMTSYLYEHTALVEELVL